MKNIKNNNVVVDFANKVNEELITRFLNSGKRSEVYIVTLTYQMDVSYELKELLKKVILLKVTIEEVEECINEHCLREVIVHVFEISNNQIYLQIIKTPKCRI